MWLLILTLSIMVPAVGWMLALSGIYLIHGKR